MIILTQIPLQKNKSLKTSLTLPSIKQAVSLQLASDHDASTTSLTHTSHYLVFLLISHLPSLTSCQDPREVRSRRVPGSQVLSECVGRKAEGECPSFLQPTDMLTKINELKMLNT